MNKRLRHIIISAYLALLVTTLNAQKEANVWYFGHYAGLDFNSGQPQVIAGPYYSTGSSSCISDSSGNFLFGTNGHKIVNSQMQTMLNGNDLSGQNNTAQGSLIIKKPGSEYLYYVFTVVDGNSPSASYGLYYSVVDMSLDGGLGGVTNEKNILLTDAWDAVDKIVGVRHENKTDIWIITRKFNENGFAAFLLTSTGINTNAVFSPSIDRTLPFIAGSIKISHDKKKLVVAYFQEGIEVHDPCFEVCNFNAGTGTIEFLYTIEFTSESSGLSQEPWGVEFSPDSKFLYLSIFTEGDNNDVELYQLDMQYYEDSTLFFDTKIKIAAGPALGLQLATDGKIYCTGVDYQYYDYVSVIHEPWKLGAACNYEPNAIYLDFDNQERQVGRFLPNVLLDYLFRFEWEGRCSAEPFIFQPNFQPEPIAIQWNFDDPGAGADSISFDLNPVHYFTHAGEFEVSVVVQYPNGRIERTSRVVTVDQSPLPDLGSDTLMCFGSDIVLNAGNEEGFYLWSNGSFGQNANELLVSDTGWYWVDVTNDVDCTVRDSIYVGHFPPPDVNEENLVITPTACGGSTGKIIGLEIHGVEPLTFSWYDADSNFLSNNIDITDLAVGNYFLHIYDGNGCTTISDAYTILDSGDIEVTQVSKEDSHCNQSSGSITVFVNIDETDELQYSIDNGSTWQIGDSIFTNLPSGSYVIRVKDNSGCEGVFADNPVTIENVDGPEVTNINVSDEIDNLSNGQINITANTEEGQVHYSINNGVNFQTDNGLFTNLSAGLYYCVVKDDYGCDTGFIIEVERSISQLIEAIAGDGNTCIGDAAVVPLKINNFTDIYNFHVILTYDTSLLSCDGYINVNEQLENKLQASIIPGTDEVVISWQGDTTTTLEENATMLELVFGAKAEGLSDIDWAAQQGESIFYNAELEEISAEYYFGLLRIFTRPKIIMGNVRTSCVGGDVSANVFIEGGSGEVDYFWEGPNGYTSTDFRFKIENVQLSQDGIYTLTVTDTIGCVESDEIVLIVNENPQIAFRDYDTLFVEPNFILKAGSGYESYLWNTGDTTDAIYIDTEGLYSVYVTSNEQCKATDSVTILLGGEPFWLPNAFSPNGDGLNDEFKPVERYDYLQTYHISIYNRWGQLIFETDNISEGWDGTYKGQPSPNGTYIYKIIYKAYSTGEEAQTKTGQLTLVR